MPDDTPQIDWEKDVTVTRKLHAGFASMRGATSFDLLVGYYTQQRENAKCLTPDGRRKWEQAYALNVLRLLAPQALRPEWVYVATFAKETEPGRFDYPDTALYGSMADAVRGTIRLLILAGEFYPRLRPAAIRELDADLAAERWEAAYGTLRQAIRGMSVVINPLQVNEPPASPAFTLVPDHGTATPVPRVVPPPDVSNSAIEYRHGKGGKGSRGTYLVAEVAELYAMLTSGPGVTKKLALALLDRIRAVLADAPGDHSDRGALSDWLEYLESKADEDEDDEDEA